jgi:hypothetical protein
MIAAELATYCVPGDPTSPALAEGYVVTFTAFYERVLMCAMTLIPPLFAIVLCPGAAQSDPLEDLAYRDLSDPVQGLHGN